MAEKKLERELEQQYTMRMGFHQHDKLLDFSITTKTKKNKCDFCWLYNKLWSLLKLSAKLLKTCCKSLTEICVD